MLTRLIARTDVVAETDAEYNAAGEYEYRSAEYEDEYEEDKEPEPSVARACTESALIEKVKSFAVPR